MRTDIFGKLTECADALTCSTMMVEMGCPGAYTPAKLVSNLVNCNEKCVWSVLGRHELGPMSQAEHPSFVWVNDVEQRQGKLFWSCDS